MVISIPEQRGRPDRRRGNLEPALGEEILHLAVAQGESEIEPDRVVDIGEANETLREIAPPTVVRQS
jgi:hypothetical protein